MEAERFEIELPPDLASFVQSRVGHGGLASSQDVLREAVRLMRLHAMSVTELRSEVEMSIADPRPSLTDRQVTDHFTRRASATAVAEDRA